MMRKNIDGDRKPGNGETQSGRSGKTSCGSQERRAGKSRRCSQTKEG
jgi:hypothetical protein